MTTVAAKVEIETPSEDSSRIPRVSTEHRKGPAEKDVQGSRDIASPPRRRSSSMPDIAFQFGAAEVESAPFRVPIESEIPTKLNI